MPSQCLNIATQTRVKRASVHMQQETVHMSLAVSFFHFKKKTNLKKKNELLQWRSVTQAAVTATQQWGERQAALYPFRTTARKAERTSECSSPVLLTLSWRSGRGGRLTAKTISVFWVV